MSDIDLTGSEGEPPAPLSDRAAPGGPDDDARHPAQRLRRALSAAPGDPAGLSAPGRMAEPGLDDGDPGDFEADPPAQRSRRIPRRTAVIGAALALLVAAATTTLALSPVSRGSVATAPTPAPLAVALPSAPPVRPSARDDAAMAYDPASGDVILYGGLLLSNQGPAALAGTWSWNGAQWTELQPAVSPPPLAGALLGYDPSTQRLVLTGGDTSHAGGPLIGSDDSWTWDGSSWSPVPAGGLPAADQPNALATDDSTGQLILVTTTAGCTGTDTWRWGSTGWVLLHPAASPPPADSDGLAYDPGSASLDLFTTPGGCDGAQEAAATTPPVWSWNGTTWSPGAIPLASVLSGAWELATSSRGDLLVTSQATYLWSGGQDATWTQVSSSPVVGDSAIAYDQGDGQVVLFGGMCSGCGGDPVPDTWTWTGSWALRDTTVASTPRPSP
jgi:hypothetical protein